MTLNVSLERICHSRLFVLLVFSAAPVFNFMAQNVIDPNFSIRRSLFYGVVLVVLGLAITYILEFVFRRPKTLFFPIFVGSSIFITLNGYFISDFVFGGFFEEQNIQPRVRYVLLIYGLFILACAGVAYAAARSKTLVSVMLAVVGVVGAVDALAFARSEFVILRAQAGASSPQTGKVDLARTAAMNNQAQRSSERNVYFILPDMMVGKEMFPRYDVDLEIFDQLESSGFDVIESSYSNAPVTGFSVPHLFNMQYFLEDGEQVTEYKMARIQKTNKKNPVYLEFKRRNYKIITINDGYDNNCGRGEDLCIRKSEGETYRYHDIQFLERTPFIRLLNIIDMKTNLFDPPVNLWAYPHRLEVPELMTKLPDPRQGPFFVYIHLALPHYPFRFAEDCSYRRFDDVGLAYSHQMRCTVKLLPKLLQRIRESDPDAIVIAQSDHGVSIRGQHLKPVSELSDDEIRENLSIFNVYRLPDDCRQYLRTGLTPVNTFRLVFACLDNREPDLLEDRMFAVYYLRWPSGGEVREWVPN